MPNLKIFKLSPIHEKINSRNWEASSYKGDVLVCSTSGDCARLKAELTFLEMVEITSGTEEICYSPWQLKDHTFCQEIIGYDNIPNEECIIKPKRYLDSWVEE